MTLYGLTVEHRSDPIGIGATHPRFSWKLSEGSQLAYRLRVGSAPGQADLWDSGRVESDETSLVAYAGEPLGSRAQAHWAVEAWSASGQAEAAGTFELGLIEPSDWKATWIGGTQPEEGGTLPAPYVRTVFSLRAKPKRARLYATAFGVFEAYLNGQVVGQDKLAPGWTVFESRVQVNTYDVTDLVKEGENAVGAILGDGWACGHLVWEGARGWFFKRPRFLAQLEIEFEDGSTQTVVTDGTWVTSEGPILASDLYNGESVDLTADLGDWASPGYDARGWSPVRTFEHNGAELQPRVGPPVRAIQEMPVTRITEPQPGVYVLHFDQNLVGVLRCRIDAPKGTQIRLRFAEMLQRDGTLYTENLRTAKVTDTIVCPGGAFEWEPKFTFHGFAFAEVTGLPAPPRPEDFTAVVWHSDCPPTGAFECSHPLVNRLYQNIVWGQKGNFLELPTDCPQRDERLGWTGDAQVFAPTACFNLDVASFFEKWAFDLIDSQREDGAVHHVAPKITDYAVSAAWADAMTIVPWTVYRHYGDVQVLRTAYPGMKGWVEWMRANSPGLIGKHGGFGDWLAIDAPTPGQAPTPGDLVATAYFAQSAHLTASTARVLGLSDEAKAYDSLAEQVKAAFRSEFVEADGQLKVETQTGYLLALGFDLLDSDQRPKALERLIADIQSRDWHLSTGFVGTPLLAPVLTALGRPDVAYKLLLQETYPGWLYPVLQGATTMWERWNSYTHEHGFGDAGMNSFNHYAYGAIGEWMVAAMAGIGLDPEVPAYKHSVIRPVPGDGIDWVCAALETRYGKLATRWERTEQGLRIEATIPPNTTAELWLPAGLKAAEAPGKPLEPREGCARYALGPGHVALFAR